MTSRSRYLLPAQIPVALLTLTVLVAALISGCGGTSAASSRTTSSSATTSSACPDVQILGLRGQAQSATKHRGLGAEVQGVADKLIADLHQHGRSARVDAVLHPARSTATDAEYTADVETGRRMTVARISSVVKACPRTKVILIGFSEGAQAVHLAVAGLTATLAAHLAAVTVFGDPLRDPTAAGVHQVHLGTGPMVGHGSDGTTPSFGTLATRTVSVCVAADNVCDMPSTGRDGPVSQAHRHAYETPAAARTIAAATLAVTPWG